MELETEEKVTGKRSAPPHEDSSSPLTLHHGEKITLTPPHTLILILTLTLTLILTLSSPPSSQTSP